MIGVHATNRAFLAAVAELPHALRPATEPRGAIHVVSWVDVATAADAGAAAIVVDGGVPRSDVLEQARAVAERIPVVVHRPGAPENEPAAEAISAIAVEVDAPRALAPTVLADALGWARALAGGALEPGPHAHTRLGVSAHLAGPVSVSLVAAWTEGGRGRFRVTALGPARTVVARDGDAAISRRRIDDTGDLRYPPVLEAPERVTLRRALAGLAGDIRLSDLADLANDLAVTAALNPASITPVDTAHRNDRLP